MRAFAHLAVRDGIEQLADLSRLLDVLFFGGQGMRGGQGVHGEHSVDVTEHDQVFLSGNSKRLREKNAISILMMKRRSNPHHVPVGLGIVRSQVLHVGREALVQPQIVPPPQSHQVTEPLRGSRDQTSRREEQELTL